jgi:hypothetical protein
MPKRESRRFVEGAWSVDLGRAGRGGTVVIRDQARQAGDRRRSGGSIGDAPGSSPPAPSESQA